MKQATLKALLLNVLLHLVLAYGIVWASINLPSSTDWLTQTFRDQNQDPAVQSFQLESVLGALSSWAFYALLIGMMASSFWIAALAQRAKVENRGDATPYFRSWAGFLLVAIFVPLAIYILYTRRLLELLVPQVGLYVLLSTLVSIFVAYWLGTGLLVKPGLKAAVPMSSSLPSIGAR